MDVQGLSPSLREWFRSNQQVALTLGSAGQSAGDETTRVDVLVPPFDSPARRLSVRAAVVVLVSTICADAETLWGTAHAMRVCGVVPTVFGLSLGALLSERALYLLTATARRGGVISYGEVAWTAYGQTAEYITAGLLHVYILRMILFHLVAVRDLLTPLVTSTTRLDVGRGNGLLFVILLIFVVPSSLLSRDMYNLRHMAYASACCLAVVLLVAGVLAVIAESSATPTMAENHEPASLQEESDLDGTIYDIVTTFPTTLLSFVSSFVIILPLHAPLEQPTNDRVRRVIRLGIIWSWMVLFLFGMSAKIFASDQGGKRSMLWIADWDGDDYRGIQRVSYFLSNALRIVAAVALLCSTTIIVHPCRANILECVQRHLSNEENCCVPGDVCHDLHEKCPEECLKDEVETADTTIPSYTSQSTTPRINNMTFLPFTTSPAPVPARPRPPFNTLQLSGRPDAVSEVTPLMSVDEDSPSPDNNSPPFYATEPYPDDAIRQMEIASSGGNNLNGTSNFPPCNIDANRPIRSTCSVMILLLCYLLSLTVSPMPSEMTILTTRGAANVWNLAKSSVGVMISFVLPVACFLRLHMFNRRHEMDLWSTLAWFLLLLVSPIFLLVWAPGWLVSSIPNDV